MPQPLSLTRRVQFAESVVDGHTFRAARFKSQGSASPRPLLFFSGIGANIELLAPFLDRLIGREIVTFDMPGLGGTAAYAASYRFGAMADVAARILGDMGFDEADVMGVIWGGMLAQEFAYRHPAIVNRLVLAATSAGFPIIPGRLSSIIKMGTSHRYTRPGSIDTYLHSLYGGSTSGLEGYASRIRPPSPRGYLHQLLAVAGWTSVRKLTRVTASTLVLMGDEDRLVPAANGYILKFLLQNAELDILTGAGHLFVLTHLGEVARKIEAFLDGPARSANVLAQTRQGSVASPRALSSA